ncbi:bifunctional precorrin-2 dehydrogenase/sirohydrochlorin ferrochelatase [uncultured Megasphaera sp.]|uniref:precorrin-2 dehydrogenase/sirohydrochlorin ferrochelatase family protein n=1 Tax=uncultured Megasphaera sp. TaxID=165188 RepID=UPI0025CE90F9|nr:bifunctional precorrin-2 dehydrogenase/sirohydrochlorin ferrochelatase [uncultured Megasphaera sp.]
MYPINVDLRSRPCLVIGGGTVAERKIAGLLDEGAAVTVIAPTATETIKNRAAAGRLIWKAKKYERGDEKPFFLIICATDDEAVSLMASQAAEEAGKLINVCDVPHLCNFTVPAVVRQGDLQLAISTNGKGPAFSRWLRQRLEKCFDERYGRWLDEVARIRSAARSALSSPRDRHDFWRDALTDDIMALVEQNDIDEASRRLARRLSEFERRRHET